MKKSTKIIGIVLALVIATGGVGTLWILGAFRKQEPYPYVFVHGLNGKGTDKTDDAESDPYWGSTAGNLMQLLDEKGVTCYAPSVGKADSAWDRACELYAQLTGGTVDYGAAHAEKYDHERFGKTYNTALIPDWGMRNGTRKINLIGHSFGGATIRVFTQLMAEGSEEERKASGKDTSPLFTGGKENRIFSVTALAAPHNGTTLLYALGGDNSGKIIGGILSALNTSGLRQQLEAFGVSLESRSGLSFDEMVKLSQTEDNSYYELTLEGAKKLNEWVKPASKVYYFSYPYDATKDAAFSLFSAKGRVGDSEMSLALKPLAAIIGSYDKNKVNDIPVDETWLPNDGLVNTISATAPFEDAQAVFSADKLERGVWNVMPAQRGDHGKPIGLGQDKDWLVGFYMEQMEQINALSEKDHWIFN
ncbi:MAG: hypothetical protein LBJ12_02525 [Oscillospiraceae bacterium]|nr:hypothetical protein [Oscillospiraceae bacterium]